MQSLSAECFPVDDYRKQTPVSVLCLHFVTSTFVCTRAPQTSPATSRHPRLFDLATEKVCWKETWIYMMPSIPPMPIPQNADTVSQPDMACRNSNPWDDSAPNCAAIAWRYVAERFPMAKRYPQFTILNAICCFYCQNNYICVCGLNHDSAMTPSMCMRCV